MLAFEESLNDEWDRDAGMREVPLGDSSFFYLGLAIAAIAIAVAVQIIILGMNGAYYDVRASANAKQSKTISAPRGIIYDRNGMVLADNKAAFAAILDPREFLENKNIQTSTLAAIQNIFSISSDDVWLLVNQGSADDFATPIVLSENVSQNQLVNLQALNLPAIIIKGDFERDYPAGLAFSTVLGYTGRVNGNDIKKNPQLGRCVDNLPQDPLFCGHQVIPLPNSSSTPQCRQVPAPGSPQGGHVGMLSITVHGV